MLAFSNLIPHYELYRTSNIILALLPLPHPLFYIAALIWKRLVFKHDWMHKQL